jgi:hypothetical protein
MPTRLTDLQINEISLVDRGACRQCTVALTKRDTSIPQREERRKPMHANAVRKHEDEALEKIVKSQTLPEQENAVMALAKETSRRTGERADYIESRLWLTLSKRGAVARDDLDARRAAVEKKLEKIEKASRLQHLAEDEAVAKLRRRRKDDPGGITGTLEDPMADEEDEEDDEEDFEGKGKGIRVGKVQTCPACDAGNADDAQYCDQCGEKL